MKSIRTVFGECDEIEKTLDYFRKNTDVDSWMNTLPTYTLWWLITVYEWYFYCGKKSFLNEQRNYVIKTITKIIDLIDDDGNTERFPGTFLDWPTSQKAEVVYGVKGLICEALLAAEELTKLYHRFDLAEICKRKVSGIRNTVCDANQSKAIAAFLYNAGIPQVGDVASILINDGAKGLSTFMSYYIFKAMSNCGCHQNALDILKEYYGAMMRLGATTFWEDFNIEWADNALPIDVLPDDKHTDIHGDFGAYCYKGYRHSLCHGWSSGPVAFLNDFVLGIVPIEAGCKTVRIKANLGNLKWAEGTFPTPYGVIYVRHKKGENDTVKSIVKAPNEVTIICDSI